MRISVDDFFEKMLLFFPEKKYDFEQSIQDFFEGVETVIIEDVFMPKVIELLKKEDDKELLEMIFSYFEEVSSCADDELLNTFTITTLEILGNDRLLLEKAKRYMGIKTTELQFMADKKLGRFL